MKIVLLNGSSVPLYEQIKEAVKNEIVEERLVSDERLPSVRELSSELNVSILTVKKAYDALEEEGFLVSRQGLGTFVASIDPSLHREEKQKELEQHLIEASRLAREINMDLKEFIELAEYISGGEYDE